MTSLRAFEAERRRGTDFLTLPPAGGRFGADPYALVALADGGVAGVLRGASELVILGSDFRVRQRLEAPKGAVALTRARDALVVTGELSRELWVYEQRDGKWRPTRRQAVSGLYGGRALAAQSARVFVGDSTGRLLWFPTDALFADTSVTPAGMLGWCHGPVVLRATTNALVVDCLLDHELVVFDSRRAELREIARIRHDGPLWGFDAMEAADTLWLAAVGVEDHPLDRTIGSFGFIDSFLYVYRVDIGSHHGNEPVVQEASSGTVRMPTDNLSERGVAVRVLTDNLSERRVVVPKAVHLEPPKGDVAPRRAFVAAAGSPRALWIDLAPDLASVERATPIDLAPGTSNVVSTHELGLVLANPLIDAWVRMHDGRVEFVREKATVDELERLGEAVVFTNLIAPWNDAQGPKSRFTCETCHFEGGVDGRTHHTGRGNVRATTKPLHGLFNNRPHFSRALDHDLAKVAHAEFRVAGMNSGRSPMFDVELTEFSWLSEMKPTKSHYDALEVRKAVMAFLMAFTPETNPRALGRWSFDALERRGAELFQRECERCHQARASTDDPATRVPFERWESLVWSEAGPLVWASEAYQQTGVVPYVHEKGARTPSLRRLEQKWPYFTNGSARDLSQVLGETRVGNVFSHAGGAGTVLSAEESEALLAFLRLL